MASSTSLALRRLISSSVVPRSVRPAASLRLFNTNAARSYEEEEDRNHRPNRTVSPRGGDFFSDMFTPTRSLSQVLNFMDQIGDSPLLASSGARRGWDVKEKDDGLHLRIDMPGLSRD
uniref:SHSP domain-containing protein n=2 Tax=Brassica oleracea var. oleracea TaxID=109376 RepID=A0A0D3B3Z5_BRAOL